MLIQSRAPGAVIVDLDALARNYALVRRTALPARCGAVVKANAYGLGVAPVARRLLAEGCREFFVATALEGVELRGVVPEAAIYVFEGATSDDLDPLISADLVPVLNSLQQIERWRRSRRRAVLHVDTGMNRLGLSSAEVARLGEDATLLADVPIDFVMTHLACADDPDHRLNDEQPRRFDALRARLPQASTSIGNSAGALLGPRQRGDLVRPGIGLYGGNPFIDRPSPVEPVVSLRARVLQLRTIDDIETVGYGATFAAARGGRTAVLGIGYADGYPRALGNCGIASLAGHRVPVIGRISMDLTCVDVSGVPESAISDTAWAELYGRDVSIDDVAQAAGTISYELMTSLAPRLERIYEGGE